MFNTFLTSAICPDDLEKEILRYRHSQNRIEISRTAPAVIFSCDSFGTAIPYISVTSEFINFPAAVIDGIIDELEKNVFKTFFATSTEELNARIEKYAESNNLTEINRSAPSVYQHDNTDVVIAVTSHFTNN